MRKEKIVKKIDRYWKKKYKFKNHKTKKKVLRYTNYTLKLIEKGIVRVVKRKKDKWITNKWIKKAILMHIKNRKLKMFKEKYFNYFDKFKNLFLKKKNKNNIRINQGTIIREGVYVGKNVICMPCFVNVGAYIGKNTMIDTWSTIGSCAYIGSNVHISGGCGIGGVLEPIQNNPVIIENNCFIGARSEIVEGVIVKRKSVISMGVFIGKSTKIYNRIEDKFITDKIIPENSVIVSGSIPYKNYSLYSAILVKKRDIKTNKKVKINKILRNDKNTK
ncbi:2,3,4,5-tetrahydropyridine-2,6-dicarboxylate N-succinyltransferase [Candidatus Vidania fulgoroideorum]